MTRTLCILAYFRHAELDSASIVGHGRLRRIIGETRSWTLKQVQGDGLVVQGDAVFEGDALLGGMA